MDKRKPTTMTIESLPSISQASSSSRATTEKPNPNTMIESMPAMSQASSSSHAASTYPVRVLKKSEYKQAALCLAEAFKDDEVVQYAIQTGDRKNSTPEKDWKLHLHMMECITYAHCISGLATVVGPNYDCVALWMAPGQNLDTFCTMLRSGMLGFNWKLSKEGKKRFFDEFLPLLHNTKHEVLGKDEDASWYLVYIGTKTGSRGKGYAKALIEHTTKQADIENRVTYLECSNPLNIKLYTRLGFRLTKKIYLTRGKKPVEMDIMTRLPVAQQLAGRTSKFGEGQEGRN